MQNINFLSFLTPPFPYFIEGNIVTYNKGDKHPNRHKLGFFDVIILTEGELYLGEENEKWKLTAGDVLILEPNKHHFPIEACVRKTVFYWLHFQTKNKWRPQQETLLFEPDIPVQTIHYHSMNNTIHIPKFQQLINPKALYTLLDLLLKSTIKTRSLALWETQQIFMQVLQNLEYNQNSTSKLAEEIEIYLRKNHKKQITNKILASYFHIHENHLARCMKKAFNCTPLDYLANYRLNQARLLLLKTDWSIQFIAEEVGFSQLSYFSLCFKKKYGVSPYQYRKQYWKT